ncbi:MAG: ABC transporter substrate-binding protein [Leptolyngbyaceae cyanobacterium MO_188.B28]|nr:ABC transporter substrate-binding protein [Leptolyngbyaceae cyanobacterium MO_188.B28]
MLYNQLKHLGVPALLAAVALGCSPSSESPTPKVASAETDTKFVAITQIVEHPALDSIRDGVKDELAAAGYEEGNNLKWMWESAQGNPAIAAQIANKFVGEQPDLIIAIATPSAQAVVSATDQIPVLFSGITDPLGAKLVTDLENPGGLVTGVSDLSPIAQHLDLIAEISPNANRIGVLYNAGESNSVSLVSLLKQETSQRNMTLVEATVANSGDVATAARSLVGKVDAVYIPTDNTVGSAVESVVKVGLDNQLPVFAADTDTVKRGAIATLSFNYYDVGRQTGQMALRVFGGEKPGNIAVESAKKLELSLNLGAAEGMGLTIPDSVISRADEVFETF